jgi:hypothetical protein
MSGCGDDDHGGLDDIFVPRDPETGDPVPAGLSDVPASPAPPTIVLEGHEWEFVPYGAERVDGVDPYSVPCHICAVKPGKRHGPGCAMGSRAPHRRPDHCRDCGVAIGEIHRNECVVELCPCCGGQFVSCDCEGDADGGSSTAGTHEP